MKSTISIPVEDLVLNVNNPEEAINLLRNYQEEYKQNDLMAEEKYMMLLSEKILHINKDIVNEGKATFVPNSDLFILPLKGNLNLAFFRGNKYEGNIDRLCDIMEENAKNEKKEKRKSDKLVEENAEIEDKAEN